jgi:hypothetical protein
MKCVVVKHLSNYFCVVEKFGADLREVQDDIPAWFHADPASLRAEPAWFHAELALLQAEPAWTVKCLYHNGGVAFEQYSPLANRHKKYKKKKKFKGTPQDPPPKTKPLRGFFGGKTKHPTPCALAPLRGRRLEHKQRQNQPIRESHNGREGQEPGRPWPLGEASLDRHSAFRRRDEGGQPPHLVLILIPSAKRRALRHHV